MAERCKAIAFREGRPFVLASIKVVTYSMVSGQELMVTCKFLILLKFDTERPNIRRSTGGLPHADLANGAVHYIAHSSQNCVHVACVFPVLVVE